MKTRTLIGRTIKIKTVPLKKFEPPQYPGQIDPHLNRVGVVHPKTKELVWHHTPNIAKKNDSIINDQRLVEKFLKNVPDTHKETVKSLIDFVRKDPLRHLIPSEEKINNVKKQVLRARHVASLLLGGKDINITYHPDGSVIIDRISHSTNPQNRNLPIRIIFRRKQSRALNKNEAPKDIFEIQYFYGDKTSFLEFFLHIN